MVFTIQGFCPADQGFQAAIEARLRRKLHPDRFTGMSGKMAALVGYVLNTVFVEPPIWELYLTTDGFLVGRVGDQLGAETFLGSYIEFVRNWIRLLRAADLSLEERIEADCRFAARVGVYGEVSA